MDERLDPTKYGELWSEAASRVFFASYREYEQRVKIANAEGVVRRQLMGVSQLIPVYVQRCFAQHYYQRQVLTAEEFLNALKQHAGYNTAVGDLVAQAVPLYHPRPGCVVLMFPDASDFHWEVFLLKFLKKSFVVVLRWRTCRMNLWLF